MIIYSVCNDYSLEREEMTEKPAGYNWKYTEQSVFLAKAIDSPLTYELGFKDGELHYVATTSNINLENYFYAGFFLIKKEYKL